MESERLRIAMFSTIVTGGAGYAALRVHDALRYLQGARSTLYVGRAERSKHDGVERLKDAREGCQPPRGKGLTIFSIDPPGVPNMQLERIIAEADIFNLHWYARFLSLRNIAQLSRSGKPVVLTVRDMNPLTGGCHFFHGCENWKRDCLPCPQFAAGDVPLPNATFEAKKTLWDFDNITIVVLSDHTAQLVKQSPLFGRCRIEKIPNPMDVSIFKPHDRGQARNECGVPRGKRAIAYLPSYSSVVKGSAQAVKALRRLAEDVPTISCVVLCAGDLDEKLDIPFETIDVGFIGNKPQLTRFYSAADVTLIPSLEETFSNTAAESLSCGTPIVGFQVGAIPEMAQGRRGRAVPVEDIDGLAAGLKAFASEGQVNPNELHRYVSGTFGTDAVGRRHLELFEELRAHAKSKSPSASRAAEAVHRPPSARHFDDRLMQYREVRTAEIRQERKSLYREHGSLRGMMTLLAYGANLFFSDNAAFRSKAWTLLTGR